MVSYLYFGKVSPHICDFIHECAANWIYGRIKNYIEFNKTIDELNRAWHTACLGYTFYDWDEIVISNLLSEHFADNRTTFQGISLDYRRFNSEGILLLLVNIQSI